MSFRLLPEDFDARLASAASWFWAARSAGAGSQAGGRGQVIGGKNLDGFLQLITDVALHCGVPRQAIHAGSRTVLPGYFRATKSWDAVIVLEGRLLAALELKSQVGSFGNNLNNRTEEALGSATDLWRAARAGAYGLRPGEAESRSDPRPPFVGFLVLVEDCRKVQVPVRADAPHFPVLPAFRGASYAERYRTLCERLMDERLYTAASLVLSARGETSGAPTLRSLSPATSPKAFFTALAGSLLANVQAPR